MSTQRVWIVSSKSQEYWGRFANSISGGTTDWGFPLTGIQSVSCNQRDKCIAQTPVIIVFSTS